MANIISMEETARPKEKTPSGWHKFWEKEKAAADKRLRHFITHGNAVDRRYKDERQNADINSDRGTHQFRLNLFHKNVKTMKAMLYGRTPQIEVKREFADPDDDIARVAGLILKRILQSDIDASGEDVATALKSALNDRLLPGLGTCRVRYDYSTFSTSVVDPTTGQSEEAQQLEYEDAPIEYVHWQDFIWGWGRTWSEIPWLGFRVWLDKGEVTQRFGEKVANNLEYQNQLPTGGQEHNESAEADQKNNVQKAEIWEFWRKEDKKVYWWSHGASLILDVKDDPLQLDAFWPCPLPMIANCTTTLFMPKSDFSLAQDLYNETDLLQTRISIITEAIKVVGVYDEGAGNSVGRMLREGHENDLIPVDNWAMFAEKGGLAGVIDWFPVQEVVATLMTLKQALGDTIELLYELTGMSDIMRGGSTDQYTSDGTNQLKAKMGSIQVQAMQDEFARFASDLEALKAEVIVKHFEVQSIAKQANVQFLPQADQDKIMPAMQLLKSPDIKWRTNIKPESIAMIDYAQLKSERTEFLTAMATYIQSAQAAVKEVPGSLPILLEMLKWGMAGFKGSDVLEGTMDQAIDMAKQAAQNPQGKDDGKQAEMQGKIQIEQMKMELEKMKGQMDLQKISAKAQADTQLAQMKLQGELQKIMTDNKADLSVEQANAMNELQKQNNDLKNDLTLLQAKLAADLQVEEAQSTYAIAETEVEHSATMAELDKQSAVNRSAQRDRDDG